MIAKLNPVAGDDAEDLIDITMEGSLLTTENPLKERNPNVIQVLKIRVEDKNVPNSPNNEVKLRSYDSRKNTKLFKRFIENEINPLLNDITEQRKESIKTRNDNLNRFKTNLTENELNHKSVQKEMKKISRSPKIMKESHESIVSKDKELYGVSEQIPIVENDSMFNMYSHLMSEFKNCSSPRMPHVNQYFPITPQTISPKPLKNDDRELITHLERKVKKLQAEIKKLSKAKVENNENDSKVLNMCNTIKELKNELYMKDIQTKTIEEKLRYEIEMVHKENTVN